MNKTPSWVLPVLLAGVLVSLVVAIVLAGALMGGDGDPAASPTVTPAGAIGSPTAAPTASPSPTTSIVASPSPVTTAPPATAPPATALPTISSAPTVPASPVPTQGASPAPTAAPTAAPDSSFRRVEGFPGPGERVSSIVAGGPGFVAVGYVDNPTTECPYRMDGRIWTSADGEHWTRQATDSLDEAQMWGVVSAGGTLYAFGYVGIPGDCPVPEGFGNNVWRSTDGIAWEQITSGIRFVSEHDRWFDVAVAGDTLVVVGRFGEAGDDEPRGGGVWTSTNGVDWQVADRAPATYELASVAAMGDTVVAFGQDSADGLAWHSQDGGRTWQGGLIEGGYVIWQAELLAAAGRFVAVARACCGVPETSVGLALTSTDGRVWSPGTDAYRHGADRGVRLPDAFLALTATGETQISTDGLRWRSGPPAPRLDPDSDFITAAGAGPAGVVVASMRGVRGGFESQAWFAPLGDFAPARWTAPPQPADWLVIGQAYPYELYTHCGAANTRIVFAGSVWIMDESTLEGRFNDPDDRGHLTQLSADRALYEGRRGGSFYLDRTDSPPPWPRCA